MPYNFALTVFSHKETL